jgi:hypothetical protein
VNVGYGNHYLPRLEIPGVLGNFRSEFVAEDTRVFEIRLLPAKGMEISTTDADLADTEHYLTICRFRFRDIKGFKMTGLPAGDGFHGFDDAAGNSLVQVSRA